MIEPYKTFMPSLKDLRVCIADLAATADFVSPVDAEIALGDAVVKHADVIKWAKGRK